MLTRRNSIVLTAKGLAALVAACPFLSGCSDGEGYNGTNGPPSTDADMDTAGVPVNDTSGSRRLDSQVTVRDDAAASARGRQDTLPTDHNSTRTEGAEAERIQSIDWDTFIADLAVLAEKQFSPEWNQDTYVDEVGALMQLLDLDDSKFQALYDGYATAASLFPDLNTVHEGGYFEVATLEFDPGDTIDLHNHPDMTGVILCLSGMLQVEAFDLLDEISDSGQLLIKRVVNREVEPGEYCTLTATHGNIHTVSAPVFTQLLDVFTPPYNDERLTRYRWYERAQTPYSGEDIFEAWEQ